MPQAQSVAVPQRLPLVLSPENRDDSTAKDARLVNGYMEKDISGEGYHLYKRPGLLTHTTKSGNGLGVFNWRDNVYAIFGSTIYKDGVSIGTGLNTAGGVYRFDSVLGGTPRLVFSNGAAGYYTDGTTVTAIASNYPAATVKGWAFLNGTLYAGTEDPALYGSEINDPTLWETDNVIIPQIEPDFGRAVAKQLVYALFMKQWTTEVFYDQQNETGTPLGRVEGALINYGCVSADGVQRMSNQLLWPATTREGGVEVVMCDNLRTAAISTKAVDRLINYADFSSVYSWHAKVNGHRFYVLTLVNENLTLAYDVAERLWAQWTDSDGNYFPISSASFTSDNVPLLQHATNGKLYTLSQDNVNDDNSLFSVDLYTPNYDGGVRRAKQLNMMEFVADQTPGSVLEVRVNDHDYAAHQWSNFRTVDLGQQRPQLTNCGTFVRRAHHFRHRCNKPLRIQAVDLQIDLGTL